MSTITVTGGAPGGPIASALTTAEAQIASNLLNGDGVALQAITVDGGAGSYNYTSASPSYVVFNDTDTVGTISRATVTGANSIIVGGAGSDRLTLMANGTVIGGDGNEFVTVNGASGSSSVNFGNGNDKVWTYGNATISVGNGNDSIYAEKSATITAGNGNNNIILYQDGALTVGSGNNTIQGGGNDTITLGTGNDSIFETGSATVTGPFGAASITNGGITVTSGSSDTILASGTNVTVQGAASGNEVLKFVTGNGVLSGGPNDTFIGGSGLSTITGGGGSNLYEFNSSTPGGTAIINNFVQGSDQLQLNGYNISTVLASDITQASGNTYINLGGGTTIELKGFTGTLHPTDFKP